MILIIFLIIFFIFIYDRDFRKAYMATLKGVCKKCLGSQDDFELNTRQSLNQPCNKASKQNRRWSQKLVCCTSPGDNSKTNYDLNKVGVGAIDQQLAPAATVSGQQPSATIISARPHNQVETEIVRLIDQQPDKILYIDEPSEFISGEPNNSHSSHSYFGKKDRSQSAFELKQLKLSKKRNYLDITDDDDSNTDKSFRERKSSSFSADVIHGASKKSKSSYILCV